MHKSYPKRWKGSQQEVWTFRKTCWGLRKTFWSVVCSCRFAVVRYRLRRCRVEGWRRSERDQKIIRWCGSKQGYDIGSGRSYCSRTNSPPKTFRMKTTPDVVYLFIIRWIAFPSTPVTRPTRLIAILVTSNSERKEVQGLIQQWFHKTWTPHFSSKSTCATTSFFDVRYCDFLPKSLKKLSKRCW